MPRNTLEHQASHRTDHQVEDIADWQKNALQPFVERLSHINPDLTRELQREYEAATGAATTTKEHVSWLDGHDKKTHHPASYRYEERAKNEAESHILETYKDALHELDQDQINFLTATIVEAMAHRPNAYLSEHFPQSTHDFTEHHRYENVPQPESYNAMMDAARDYYKAAMEQTEYLLTEELQSNHEWDPYSITWAVDTLRSLEQDLRDTAEHSVFPQYLDTIDESHDFTRRYMERGSTLAEEFSQSFKQHHPDLKLDPESPEYVEHFHKVTEDYSKGDLRNAADYIAYNHGIDKANREGASNPQELHDKMGRYRSRTFEELARYPHGTA